MGYLSSKEADYEKAYEYYKEASDAGYGKAANAIGDMYYYGSRGVDAEGNPDYQMAKQWYEKAMDAGCVWAMRNLANMYLYGRLESGKDEEKGLRHQGDLQHYRTKP